MTDARISAHDIRAKAAALRLWLLDLLVWFLGMLCDGALTRSIRRWIFDEVRHAELVAKAFAVAIALAQRAPAARLPGQPRPERPDIDRIHRGSAVRLFTRGLLRRAGGASTHGPIPRRIARLRAFLAAIDAMAVRIGARLARGFCFVCVPRGRAPWMDVAPCAAASDRPAAPDTS